MAFVLSLNEIIDIVIITFALGYIFSGTFGSFLGIGKKEGEYDPLAHYMRKRPGFDWDNFKFAALSTAPAIILHEFGHKFVAMYFGATATFHAAYMWLGLGVLLKIMNTGMIFFVPAFVSHTPVGELQGVMISFAGPAVNLILWIGAMLLTKNNILKISRKYMPLLVITEKVNMFLFIFNMIPIPGFDGYWVFSGLIHIVLG